MSILKHFFNALCRIRKTYFPIRPLLRIFFGAALISFSIYHIHQQADITEGGLLGSILLLNHWFNIAPSRLSLILDGILYLMAFKMLGKDFIQRSLIASLSLGLWFFIWEHLSISIPWLIQSRLMAALIGGLGVGLGAGIIIVLDASSGGDDILALLISKHSPLRLAHAYLIADLVVLILSLSYIPLHQLIYSLITVLVSSYTIDLMQKLKQSSV